MDGPVSKTDEPTFAAALRPGMAALRELWLPFVVLQLLGCALVVAYFQSDSVRNACEQIGQVKRHWGVLFATITMPITAGLLPEVLKFVLGMDRSLTGERLKLVLHSMTTYAVAGTVVDLFYTGLAHAFGDEPRVGVVLAKLFIDQLLYTPLIGVPMIALSFTLRHNGYQVGRTVRELSRRWYLKEVMPLLVPTWAYWWPMCSLMYLLPRDLTFPFGATASAAAATIMIAIATRKR
jgi:hypothetical protein